MKRQGRCCPLAALLAIVLIFSGCGKTAEENGTKKFIVATDTTFAPFEFEENGELKGIDMDILKAAAADQGFSYDIKVLGFNAAVTALEAGQADAVIAGMSVTDSRKLKYDFSDPYYEAGVVMAVASDNTEISSYEDLAGKTAAVKTSTQGSRFAEELKKKIDFKIKYFEDSASMYDELAVGNSDACFEDFPVISYAIKQGRSLKIPFPNQEASSSYALAVLKGRSGDLLDMFNRGLAHIKENGIYQEIIGRYITE